MSRTCKKWCTWINSLIFFFVRCQVLVVGGGSGGCAVAAKMSNKLGEGKVIIVEPADVSSNTWVETVLISEFDVARVQILIVPKRQLGCSIPPQWLACLTPTKRTCLLYNTLEIRKLELVELSKVIRNNYKKSPLFPPPSRNIITSRCLPWSGAEWRSWRIHSSQCNPCYLPWPNGFRTVSLNSILTTTAFARRMATRLSTSKCWWQQDFNWSTRRYLGLWRPFLYPGETCALIIVRITWVALWKLSRISKVVMRFSHSPIRPWNVQEHRRRLCTLRSTT